MRHRSREIFVRRLAVGLWSLEGNGRQELGVIHCVRGVASPLLANIYLNPLDHLMMAKGYQMVRYADDCVVCAKTEAEAHAGLAHITAWRQEARLKLHPTKTRIVNAAHKGGFDFLGYHFEQYRQGGGKKWP